MVIDDPPSPDARTVEATETSFRIVEALKRTDKVGASALARELDLPKSTVYKHLRTLHEIGYVVKDQDGYRLSLEFIGLGNAARSHFPLIDLVQEPLEKLAETSECVVSLMLPEQGYGYHAFRIIPPEADQPPFNEGVRLPLHATAGGKAILAYLPDSKRQWVLENRELTAVTDKTITDRDELIKELQNVHDSRSTQDNGEYHEGVHCVASPVTDENNHAVGAISVTVHSGEGTEHRLGSDLRTLLGSTTYSIEARLESSKIQW